MKNLKLDSILLFILIIPFIMTYGIGPGETPFWLFGLIFLAILLYAIFDLGWFHKKEKVYIRFKTFLKAVKIFRGLLIFLFYPGKSFGNLQRFV